MEITLPVSQERRRYIRQLSRFANQIAPPVAPDPRVFFELSFALGRVLHRYSLSVGRRDRPHERPLLLQALRAAEYARDKLSDATRAFHQCLAEYDRLRRRNPSDLLREMLAVAEDDRFESVEYDPLEQTFIARTAPIVLESEDGDDVDLGPFELVVTNRLQHLEIIARAIQPNPAHSDSDVTHPHVNRGHICFGEARAAAQKAAEEFRIVDLLTLADTVLQHYNPASPYVRLSEWHGSDEDEEETSCCENCDEVIYDDDLRTCNLCHEPCCRHCRDTCYLCGQFGVCGRCEATCSDCDSTGCTECVRDCELCGRSRCSSCRYTCEGCGGSVCDDCHGVCEACGDVWCKDCRSQCAQCQRTLCSDGCTCPCVEEEEEQEPCPESESEVIA